MYYLNPKIMKSKIVILISFMLLFGSCSSVKMYSDQKADVDYSEFNSYQIEYENNIGGVNQYMNELNKNRFDNSLNNLLASRGMTNSTTDPDILIKVVTDMSTQTNYNTTHSNFGMMGRRSIYGGRISSDTREYDTNIGHITISLHDPQSKELLWYTTVEKELIPGGKNPEKKMDQLVEKLLEKFPVSP